MPHGFMETSRNDHKTACKYIPWSSIQHEKLNDLIDRGMLVGDNLMLARVFLKKSAHVPEHHHHNEQVTYILKGALKFAIDGQGIVVRAGEVLCIPPNMPHEAWPSKTSPMSMSSIRPAKTG
jgi:quercetin dioxygenase-like cupin family protein